MTSAVRNGKNRNSDTVIRPLLLTTLFLAAARADDAPRLSADKAASLCEIDTTPVPRTAVPQVTSFAPLLERVTPSVVSVFPATIRTESTDAGPLDRFFGKDDKEEENESDATPSERIRGVGSGVIISPDGWIVTNSHVVHLPTGKIADTFFVELQDHRRFHAKIAGIDPMTDLALLKIEATGLTPLKLADSEGVQPGDLVFAVGNPFKVGITCTMGMVSATRRSNIRVGGEGTYESYIQTDAAINPGNSGGALVDSGGRLVGINTAILGGGGGNIGIGFAIPSNLVRHVISRLAADGKVVRGFFGISSVDLNDGTAAKAKLPTVAGAMVEAVMEGSPAGNAGLKTGDVIVRVGPKEIVSRGDLRFELSLLKPGDSVSVAYWRDGSEQSATLTAINEEAAKETAGDKGAATKASAALDILPGVTFHPGDGHVVVGEVTSKSAKRSGLVPGMTLIHVNGTEITDMASLEGALKSGVNKVKVLLNDVPHTLAIHAE